MAKGCETRRAPTRGSRQKGGGSCGPPAPKPKPKPQRAPNAALPHFEVGSQARDKAMGHDLKPSPGRKLATAPLRMDEKAYRRMKRGKLKPEGKLDLHGMRIDTAHGALTRFILTAQAADKRLVLVITGKGKDRYVEGPMPRATRRPAPSGSTMADNPALGPGGATSHPCAHQSRRRGRLLCLLAPEPLNSA